MLTHLAIDAFRWLHRRKIRGLWRGLHTLSYLFPGLRELRMELPDGRFAYLDLREYSHISLLIAGDHLEKHEENFIRSFIRQGDIVLDIGAYCGVYTTLFSRLVGREGKVYAFEPNSRMYRLLKKTILEYPNVDLYSYGLSSQNGTAYLSEPTLDASMATIRPVDKPYRTQVIELTTLDIFTEENHIYPTFIKCDVEGNEYYVVLGAKRLISTLQPPAWMIEHLKKLYQENSTRIEDLISLFENSGRRYSYYLIREKLIPIIPSQNIPEGNIAVIPDWLLSRVSES